MATKAGHVSSSENTTQTGKHFVDNVSSQDSVARKTLRTLQLSALDENQLVGKGGVRDENGKCPKKIRPSNEPVSVYEDDEITSSVASHRENQATQTDNVPLAEEVSQDQVTDAVREALELMGDDFIPENYWQQLAEERRQALNDTLEENEQLHSEVDSLREENEKLTEVASHVEYLSSFLEGYLSSDEDNSADDEYKTGDEGHNKSDDNIDSDKNTSNDANSEDKVDDNVDDTGDDIDKTGSNDDKTDGKGENIDKTGDESDDNGGVSGSCEAPSDDDHKSDSNELCDEKIHSTNTNLSQKLSPCHGACSVEPVNPGLSRVKHSDKDGPKQYSGDWVNVELDDDKVASTEIIKAFIMDAKKNS